MMLSVILVQQKQQQQQWYCCTAVPTFLSHSFMSTNAILVLYIIIFFCIQLYCYTRY